MICHRCSKETDKWYRVTINRKPGTSFHEICAPCRGLVEALLEGGAVYVRGFKPGVAQDVVTQIGDHMTREAKR